MSGGKIFQQREQKSPEVGTKASKKPSVAGAAWADLGWERW